MYGYLHIPESLSFPSPDPDVFEDEVMVELSRQLTEDELSWPSMNGLPGMVESVLFYRRVQEQQGTGEYGG